MKAIQALKYFARNKYAWPGGYPMFAVCADGGILSHTAIKQNYRLIFRATQNPGTDKQWEVTGVDINWEDDCLFCDHTGEHIPSAYGEGE